MTRPAGQQNARGINAALLKPFMMASVLAILALVISLGFLAYTAWTSSNRLAPLQAHITHLQQLQEASVGIQEMLLRHIDSGAAPDAADVSQIRNRLEALVANGGHLDPNTPDALREAHTLLDPSGSGDVRAGLLGALKLVRQTLQQENSLQQSIMADTRRSAEMELAVAGGAMLLAPLLAMLILAAVRRRFFGSIGRLSDLLENVGNQSFARVEKVPGDDPLRDVYFQYNQMADKLQQAADRSEAHTAGLESQVRAATETLFRQQAELENAARLAAIGEFSASLAHELRNPVSGVSAALHNMEQELEDGETRDRVILIADEMERITRLLNALLEKGRATPEQPCRVDTGELVASVINLYRYQLSPEIELSSTVEARECMLPRDTFRQILINLLRNSADAIGGRPGHISVSLKHSQSSLTLVVEDDGPGFPAEILAHGIRPFGTNTPGGTGLGLPVIQRLVHASGGDIELGSSTSGGARTVVSLPCPAWESSRPAVKHED